MYPKLQTRLGLHESIDIYYIVTGYMAILSHETNKFLPIEGTGPTIEAALQDLESQL